ncbi:MAG: heme-binding domain-containing protein [Ferruginibacter sp.]
MKRNRWRSVTFPLLAALLIIQFFQTEKNVDNTPAAFANDINKQYQIPQHVQEVLRNSCYDCHSNNTNYPWYDNIQPVAWWMQHHIKEGKRELNFNEFTAYRVKRQYKKLDEIIKEVKGGDMPLSSYTFIHKDAKLTEEQKQSIVNWATASMDSLKKKYPSDSLLAK